MGGGDKVEASPMSPEERALLRKQGQAADLGLDILQDQTGLANAIVPQMFEEAGVEPIYREQGDVDSEIAALERRLDRLSGKQFTETNRNAPYSSMGIIQMSGFNRPRSNIQVENEAVTREMRQLERQIADLRRTGVDEIIGFNKIADPTEDVRKEIEMGFLERTRAALAGELPVNPGLLRDLDNEERKLEETLRSRLGTGFETSTAGIQALDEFSKTKLGVLDASRRSDLVTASNQAIGFRGFNESLKDTFLQRIAGAGSYKNALLGGSSTVGANFASPASAYAAQRQYETNVALQNAQNSGSGFLGSIVGGVAGSFANPFGSALGNKALSIFTG